MQIEIVNPRGVVSYRRPKGHPDIAEALRTTGYSVRFEVPPGINAYAAMTWPLLGCKEPDRHASVWKPATRRLVVWCIDYKPTPEELVRAQGWANDHGPERRDDDGPQRPNPPDGPSYVESVLRMACADDALMDECLAFLKVGYEKGDDLREIMRHVCGNFALRAFGIVVPGQPPLSPDEPAAPTFPAKGMLAWHHPSMTLVRITQQHDALEWEVRTYPLVEGHKEARFVIAAGGNLDPLTEGEQLDAELGSLPNNRPHCRASSDDGFCAWRRCPQVRDGEPGATGRHCPYDRSRSSDKEAV